MGEESSLAWWAEPAAVGVVCGRVLAGCQREKVESDYHTLHMIDMHITITTNDNRNKRPL